jgi:hypothetical protein
LRVDLRSQASFFIQTGKLGCKKPGCQKYKLDTDERRFTQVKNNSVTIAISSSGGSGAAPRNIFFAALSLLLITVAGILY